MATANPGIDVDPSRSRRSGGPHPPCVRRAMRISLLAAMVLVAGPGLHDVPPAAAADDTVAEPRPAHRYVPPGFGGPLADYDLAAERAENSRRRDAGQAHSFTSFMLQEYVDAHHPGVAYTWQRPANRAFASVGTSAPGDERHGEVYVRWQSLSDGLQWGFSETEILRHTGPDPFAVVADAGALSRIRDAVAADGAGPPVDVFLERTREVVTDQHTRNLAFGPATSSSERYGVNAGGRVRFFTLSGEPIVDPPG